MLGRQGEHQMIWSLQSGKRVMFEWLMLLALILVPSN